MECLEGITETLDKVIQTICGRISDREPPLPDIPKLNDSLYEFHKPADQKIHNLEVMFFHGLQQQGDASRAHVDAWTSFDGSNSFYWPLQLLAEEFPRAKLLSVSYDSCAERGPTHGRLDRYCVAENLIHDLTGARGHTSGRPVILVGRDMGGLVIKAVCLRADQEKITSPTCEAFLNDIKGILFYCTPHLGFQGLPRNVNGALVRKLGLLDVDTARLSAEFKNLRTYKGWKTKGIGSSTIESEFGVPEASSRYDVDQYYTFPHALHCLSKPRERTDISYSFLSDLIKDSTFQPPPQFKSSLYFEIDENYVPMEDTLKQIRIAFQKSRVVVLHGDSGTGKSSLARHFALCFEKEEVMKKMDDQGQTFSSPVVCCVSCGCRAVTDIQDELLWIFAVEYPRQDFENLGRNGATFQQTHRLRITLANHLRDRHALVILDDVWESELLEKVLVPGANVKYLITTRDADMWPDPNSESVRMQRLNLHDARHIIANYAKFEGGCIPPQFEAQADELIKEADFYPLALATLGTVLQRGHKFNVEEWTSLKNNLVKYMESDRYRSISIGERYPRNVSAALMLLVNPKFLDDGAMNLLCIINLFRGAEISESLVKSFLTNSHPSALTDYYPNIKVLAALNLVRLERRPILYFSKLLALEASLVWPGDTLREAGGEAIPFKRVIVIHDMRQKFIHDKKREAVNGVTRFIRLEREFCFDNRSDHDWATVLCSMCGVGGVKEEAQQKMGCLFKWSDGVVLSSSVLINWLDLLPLYGEGQSLGFKSSNETVDTCIEMLWMFLVNRRIDGESISVVFKGKNLTEGMCEFFVEVLISFLFALHGTRLGKLPDTEMSVSDCVDTLIDFLKEDCATTMQRNVLLALNYLMAFTDLRTNDPRRCLLDTQKLLDRAVTFLSKEKGDRCRFSVLLIAALVSDGHCSATVIVNIPDFLRKLVGLLAEDVDSAIQDTALFAFGPLISHVNRSNVVTDMLATVITDLLQRVVTIFSSDMGHRCKQATFLVYGLAQSSRFAMVILSFPNCLDRLVELLAQGVQDSIQEYALGALSRLATATSTEATAHEIQVKMERDDIFDRLMTFLSKDKGERCELSASVLAQLAESPLLSMNTFTGKFCSVSGCLAKLVELLVEDVNESIQMQALRTLVSLTFMANKSRQQREIHFKMLETTDLLQRLKTMLSKDMGSKCTLSASLVAELARAPGIAEIIVNLPGCLEKFASLLDKDVEEDIQFQAVRALFSLIVGGTFSQVNEVHIKILGTKDLLERVIEFLAKDAGHRCVLAAGCIMGLAAELTRQASTLRTQLSGCLENLVRMMADDADNRIQCAAISTLKDLAMHGGGNLVLLDMLATIMPDLLHRIAMFLSPNLGEACEDALLLVAQLVLAPRIAVMTVEFSGCLEKIVQLLAVDVQVILQKQALRVLGRLGLAGASCQTNNIHAKMVKTRYLFDKLIMFLSKDMDGRCMLAASAIGNMGAELVNQSSSLGSLLSDCLKRLIDLLDEDVDTRMQECALSALSGLAVRGDHHEQDGLHLDTQTASDLLQRVIILLSKDKGERCGKSAFLVARLAHSPFWAVKILSVPGFFDKVVRLLAESAEETIQEHALRFFHRLAIVASQQTEEVQWKMLEADNLLASLTMFMSTDMGERCELSVSVFEELTKVPSAATMIVNCPGCLDKFVQLLGEGVQTGLRSKVLRALENLALCSTGSSSGDSYVPSKMVNTKNLFSRIIMLLSQETKERCDESALLSRLSRTVSDSVHNGEILDLVHILASKDLCQGVVMLLSRDMGPRFNNSVVLLITAFLAFPRYRRYIAMFPGCLDGLAKLLTQGVEEYIQHSAMTLIFMIGQCGEQEILLKMLATDSLMEGMTTLLSKDKGWFCVSAAATISRLSTVPGVAVSTARFPEWLDRLVSLLAQDVEDTVQVSTLAALHDMALSAGDSDQELLFRMLHTPLLDNLVTYLTEDISKQCEMAVMIIYIFTSKAPTIRPLLAPVAGLIEGLLVLLRNYWPQWVDTLNMAMKVLTSLPARDKIEKEMSKMGVLPINRSTIYRVWSYENAMLMDYSAALNDINCALELSPESGFLYQERGVLRRLMEDFQGALEDLNAALKIDADDYEILKHRALVRYKVGDIEGACADAERAVLVKPSRVDDDSYGEGCLGGLSVELMTYKLK